MLHPCLIISTEHFFPITAVECPYPEDIENGFINFALRNTYRYADRVNYGCNPRYVIDGAVESRCEKTGRWSPKPTCRGIPLHLKHPQANSGCIFLKSIRF